MLVRKLAVCGCSRERMDPVLNTRLQLKSKVCAGLKTDCEVPMRRICMSCKGLYSCGPDTCAPLGRIVITWSREVSSHLPMMVVMAATAAVVLACLNPVSAFVGTSVHRSSSIQVSPSAVHVFFLSRAGFLQGSSVSHANSPVSKDCDNLGPYGSYRVHFSSLIKVFLYLNDDNPE